MHQESLAPPGLGRRLGRRSTASSPTSSTARARCASSPTSASTTPSRCTRSPPPRSAPTGAARLSYSIGSTVSGAPGPRPEEIPRRPLHREAGAPLVPGVGHHRAEVGRPARLHGEERLPPAGPAASARRSSGRLAGGHPGLADEGDLLHPRGEVGPAVEGIDPVGVAEADAAEQLLHAARRGADLADHRLRVGGEHARVDHPLGEERLDELLVLLRELVGLGVAHPGEVAAHRLPEVAGAVGLERGHQLGEHLEQIRSRQSRR